ncbi:hypothetical protein FRB99_008925 [Tulasnella sp. 403]|nr:hypothetical protein FRB99_008925 [Tulasnella sp. 403]
MGHTIAGVDTSATALSYMMYILALRPDMLAKLRAESDSLMPTMNKVASVPLQISKSSTSCLTLSASSKNLRLPFLFDVKGYTIPAGTIVGTQVWCVHRRDEVFPNAFAFKPEPWLDETVEMRVCTSSEPPSIVMSPNILRGPFAPVRRTTLQRVEPRALRAQDRYSLVATIRNFDIVIPPETTAGSMDCRFAFVLLPTGQKVSLISTPRKE